MEKFNELSVKYESEANVEGWIKEFELKVKQEQE